MVVVVVVLVVEVVGVAIDEAEESVVEKVRLCTSYSVL